MTKKRWRSSGGSRTGKTHREINGTSVALDERFEVGKSKLMYPGDPSGEKKLLIAVVR
ncbi:protein of unknown function [Paenibacillus alvei]|uniref:Uncharacterized protein n=1 Tax=Paenibacillus alvei TaxID=44250 RepID=A0A383RIM0_PAEAL|nr:protein of unknown function [Paenibacillus alvei]